MKTLIFKYCSIQLFLVLVSLFSCDSLFSQTISEQIFSGFEISIKEVDLIQYPERHTNGDYFDGRGSNDADIYLIFYGNNRRELVRTSERCNDCPQRTNSENGVLFKFDIPQEYSINTPSILSTLSSGNPVSLVLMDYDPNSKKPIKRKRGKR